MRANEIKPDLELKSDDFIRPIAFHDLTVAETLYTGRPHGMSEHVQPPDPR